MSRTFTIKELNEKIDKMIAEHAGASEDYIAALEDLKHELNDPEAAVSLDWVVKIQESLNIIETNKIIKDGL